MCVSSLEQDFVLTCGTAAHSFKLLTGNYVTMHLEIDILVLKSLCTWKKPVLCNMFRSF